MRKIPGALRQRRRGGNGIAISDVVVLSVVEKEESLVLAVIQLRHAERATDGSAPLVVAVRCAHRGERIARVEEIIAEEFAGRAVVQVRAALGRHVDHTAKREAILRGHGSGLHLELLHGVDAEVGVEIGVVAVLRHHPVYQQVVGCVRSAIDAQIAKTGSPVGETALHRAGVRVDVRRQQYQGERIPSIERKVRHKLVLDHLAYGWILHIHQRRFRGDGYRFARCAYLQSHVDFGGLVDLQTNACSYFLPEARVFDRHPVVADVYGWCHKKSRAVRQGGGGGVGVNIGDRHAGAGDRGAARIGHAAENSTAPLLAAEWEATDKQEGEGIFRHGS